jgi:hypothetical protein
VVEPNYSRAGGGNFVDYARYLSTGP